LKNKLRKQWCCPWPWSLLVLKEKITVLSPGLGFETCVYDPDVGLDGPVLDHGLGVNNNNNNGA